VNCSEDLLVRFYFHQNASLYIVKSE
jgi:hypothetical protein